jgi:putative transposase
VGGGHHLRALQKGLLVFGRDHGLALAQGPVVATLQHHNEWFFVAALEEALALYGTPEIFNTDQGSQFTSSDFTTVLATAGVAISMDGVGRAIDNVFIERLWRTLKYDHLYMNPAESGTKCRAGITDYLRYYNEERPHSSLDDQTPDEVYYEARINQRVA